MGSYMINHPFGKSPVYGHLHMIVMILDNHHLSENGGSTGNIAGSTIWQFNIAMENHHLQCFFPSKVMFFHGYVKLPDSTRKHDFLNHWIVGHPGYPRVPNHPNSQLQLRSHALVSARIVGQCLHPLGDLAPFCLRDAL